MRFRIPSIRNASSRGRCGEAGFSLIEVLIVLMIIGLVATLVGPRLLGQLDKSKVTTAKVQSRSLLAALETMRLDIGRFPTTDEGLQIGLKITHQEMANLIGSTRETISLTLAQFKKKNLLDMNGRTVVLLDLEGLKAAT